MKTKTAVIIAAMCIAAGGAWAVPYLQLDIGGGTYVGGTDESVFSVGNPFTVYALVDTTSSQFSSLETYYLSVAIVPQTDPNDSAFGSFDIDGVTYDSGDMEYGTPPSGSLELLPPHDIFDTHFMELSFTDLPGLASEYNSELDPGGPTEDAGGTLGYKAFEVDIAALADGLSLHFDLYTLAEVVKKNGTTKTILSAKAPFSHDAQSNGHDVTDGGATLALLGLALVGIDRIRRKFH